MIIIDDPSEFLMGSPDSEVGRTPLEFQHRRRPGRPFEIASKEVTREQFARFLLVRPAMKYVYDNLYRPDDTRWDGLSDFHPQGYVQWYEAAAYCNWLSELEGLPESELCFIPNVDGEYAEGMGLAPDYLRRLGYRLPTECEWEYACRSGTSTVYYHGDSDDVHHRYANYLRVPSQTSLEVGSLLPNTWGLFDSLGNVSEWCMHRYRDYQLDVQAGLSTDFEDMDVVKDHVNRVVRGGGYANNRQHARAAGRVKMRAFDRYPSVGFRVARTRRRPAAPDPDQLREEVILSFDSRRYESAMAKIARLPNLRDDTELLAMQGHCYGTLGMPSEAIESLRQAHAAGSTAVDTWYCLGILYVQDGHITQFEDLRSTMRDQFAKVGDSPATAARARNLCFAVRPSLIVPDTTDNAATAVRCAQYAVDFAPNDYWYRSCLAMAQYRAGNLTDAVTNLRQAIRDHNGRGAPIDLLFLSMASQQLGRSTEAREFLERAVVLMDEARKMQGAERWLRWWDSVEFDIVLKEARQMNDQTRITGSDSNSK
jgi:formylglycine-generating enzyme required for sulfatase activity/Flp pilus assembly protein TadD